MTDTPHDYSYPHSDTGRDAEIVPLRPGRDHTTAPDESAPIGGPAPVPVPDGTPDGPGEPVPDGPRPEHTDTAADGPVLEGDVVRVDTADTAGPGWLASLPERTRTRRPIVPAYLRSRDEAKQTIRWVAQHAAYVAGYQVTRSPKYAAKLAIRAPHGLFRLVNGTVRWTFDLEGLPVRLATVHKADPEAYLKVSRQRDSRVRLRVWVSGIGTALTIAGGWWMWTVANDPDATWTQKAVVYGICAAAIGVLGALGRPADSPLIDRSVVPAKVAKLTSDVVIRALGSLGLPAISSAIAKNPKGAIEFRAPIMRDGPGWLALLDLPEGVTVDEVMDKRDKLSSGLRRSLGCVWPEPVPDTHTGRLALWVGDQDMNKARPPAWPLAKSGTVDLFKATPLGHDQRGRAVAVTLMFVSVVIGSIPRMGKTFLLRLLCLIAALDPRAELHLYDLKGTGDLDPLEPVAHRHRAGEEDHDIEYALNDMRGLGEELRRRAKVIRELPKDMCPENKVTSELASKKSLGLHPIVVAVDECQVWFEHSKHGDEFEAICTDLVKRGPALGIVLIVATQRPDKKSLPTGISANAVLRMCLKVMGHTENDMVLGSGAHKNGIKATMFSFNDKGIFYFAGEGDAPRIVRGVYLDAPSAEKIALRARAARQAAGTLSGHALGEDFDTDTGPAYDLLKDIIAVVPATGMKVWNETVVDRLAELRPDTYGPWAEMERAAKTAQLTNALKPYGVSTGQVWGTTAEGKGANRTGIARTDIIAAITERDRNRVSGGGS